MMKDEIGGLPLGNGGVIRPNRVLMSNGLIGTNLKTDTLQGMVIVILFSFCMLLWVENGCQTKEAGDF